MSENTVTLEVVSAGGKHAPLLRDGHDAAVAKQLGKMFEDAQYGMRRIVALGLFAWEIKERQLKHGQWGAWLAAHAPNLCRVHSMSGKSQPSQALQNYMTLTEGVLEKVGFKTIGAYLDHVSNPHYVGICHHGKFLLCAEKEVPEAVRPIRAKICELVDGKTQSQLFFEFKQADEATGAPKRGRLKGQGGSQKTIGDTVEETIQMNAARALRQMGVVDDTLGKLHVNFLAQPDAVLTAWLATLDRTALCVRKWLATPPAQRSYDDIAKLFDKN